MRTFLICIFACLMLTALAWCDPPAEAASVAQKWLGLLDAGRYEECWAQALPANRGLSTFKMVPEAQWIDSVRKVRLPAGRLISRKVKTATPMSYPAQGSPVGFAFEQVTYDYTSTFEKKANVNEVLNVTQDRSGHWFVNGYMLTP